MKEGNKEIRAIHRTMVAYQDEQKQANPGKTFRAGRSHFVGINNLVPPSACLLRQERSPCVATTNAICGQSLGGLVFLDGSDSLAATATVYG